MKHGNAESLVEPFKGERQDGFGKRGLERCYRLYANYRDLFTAADLRHLVAMSVLSLAVIACSSSISKPKLTTQTEEGDSKVNVLLPRILVRFKSVEGVNTSVINALHASLGARVVQRYKEIPGLEAVEIPAGRSFDQILQAYKNNPLVLYAEPDQTVTTQSP